MDVLMRLYLEIKCDLRIGVGGVLGAYGFERLFDVIAAEVVAKSYFKLRVVSDRPTSHQIDFFAEFAAEVRADGITSASIGRSTGAGYATDVVPAVSGVIKIVGVGFECDADGGLGFESVGQTDIVEILETVEIHVSIK